MMPFTGHNIALPGGQTLPGTPLTESNGVCQAALRILALCCKPGARVADLGCLEGGYSLAFARAGYNVLGVEAKAQNAARCDWVWQQAGKPANLRFACGDARTALLGQGDFDAVFCAGLLYHLDEPDAFLKMLGTVTKRVLLLQTHFSDRPDTTHEGRRGHWYADSESSLHGSHGNSRSFWMTKPSLRQAIRDAGFPLVLTQHDYLDDIAAGPQGQATPQTPCGGITRGMFAGVKP